MTSRLLLRLLPLLSTALLSCNETVERQVVSCEAAPAAGCATAADFLHARERQCKSSAGDAKSASEPRLHDGQCCYLVTLSQEAVDLDLCFASGRPLRTARGVVLAPLRRAAGWS